MVGERGSRRRTVVVITVVVTAVLVLAVWGSALRSKTTPTLYVGTPNVHILRCGEYSGSSGMTIHGAREKPVSRTHERRGEV